MKYLGDNRYALHKKDQHIALFNLLRDWCQQSALIPEHTYNKLLTERINNFKSNQSSGNNNKDKSLYNNASLLNFGINYESSYLMQKDESSIVPNFGFATSKNVTNNMKMPMPDDIPVDSEVINHFSHHLDSKYFGLTSNISVKDQNSELQSSLFGAKEKENVDFFVSSDVIVIQKDENNKKQLNDTHLATSLKFPGRAYPDFCESSIEPPKNLINSEFCSSEILDTNQATSQLIDKNKTNDPIMKKVNNNEPPRLKNYMIESTSSTGEWMIVQEPSLKTPDTTQYTSPWVKHNQKQNDPNLSNPINDEGNFTQGDYHDTTNAGKTKGNRVQRG